MDDFDPVEFLAQPVEPEALAPITPKVDSGLEPAAFDPVAFLAEADEEEFGTPGQMALSAVEGAARGVIGPLAPLIQTKVLGMSEEDILGRQRTNPGIDMTGEAVGLIGSTVAVPGLGLGMEVAAKGAAKLAASVAPKAFAAGKVGSAAVKAATEMAVLQTSNEVSRMVLNDPNTSAESAIANVGLAAALGGGAGAFFTGAVSPLWKATAGPKLEKGLMDLRDHMNGGSKLVPEELKGAANTLGLKLPDELAGANTSDARRTSYANLKRAENPVILKSEQQLNKEVSESVANSLGVTTQEVAEYSENQAGHRAYEIFEKELDVKYKPLEAAYKARNEEAAKILVSDEARLGQYDKLITQGIEKVGTDSPQYRLYNDWSQRLLAQENIGGIDKLVTELGNDIYKAGRAGDNNVKFALADIRNSFKEFQEVHITNSARDIFTSSVDRTALDNLTPAVDSFSGRLARETKTEYTAGVAAATAEGRGLSSKLVNERADLSRQYKEFAEMQSELMDHLSIGNFRGAGSLKEKLSQGITPEQLLKKFSFKNNADFIPFLQKYYPETLKEIQKNELKSILKSSVLSAKGENVIDTNKLSKIIIEKTAGKKEYVEALFSPEALAKIDAARVIQKAIPTPRDSGTTSGIMNSIFHMPATAMAAIAGTLGHSPILGGAAGYLASILGKSTPEAVKLGLLKFAGSDAPVKSEGFKAAVDMINAVIKSDGILKKATKNVFVPGAQVLATNLIPSKADNDKLDKQIQKYQKHPDMLMQMSQGDAGHYMPEHQEALTQSIMTQVQYLQSLKPQPYQPSPLDRPIDPTPGEVARYNRALGIANQPAVVLQHVKDGTLQDSDIQDLKAMFPALYSKFATDLTKEMAHRRADDEPVPYRTRMSLSLFLGQPMDSSMTPASIQAAQPLPQDPPVQGQAETPKRNTAKLGTKTNKNYQTSVQAAQADRATRD